MIKAVIFDLDGTLADSKPTIIRMFQMLFVEFGFPKPSARRVAKLEPFGRRKVIEGLLPTGKRGDAKLLELMSERCGVIGNELLAEIRPMRGASESLSFIKGRGLKVAVATNRGQTTKRLLELLGLVGYIDAVVTSVDVTEHKPHPEPLLLALRKLGVTREEALFVGDSKVDLQAGAAAGIKTVLLTKRRARGPRLGALPEVAALLGKG